MKKLLTVEQAKQMIQELKGHKVMVKLNKGRNRIKKCSGKVVEVHPNVFVIELLGDLFDRISCTYVDVICGEVSLTKQSVLQEIFVISKIFTLQLSHKKVIVNIVQVQMMFLAYHRVLSGFGALLCKFD